MGIQAGSDRRVDLVVGGMTCSSCAGHVERRLNGLDGVFATVNYATATASVTAPDGLPPEELLAAVEAAGYSAHLSDGHIHAEVEDLRPAREGLVYVGLLTLPVLVLSMVPSLQFDYWQWFCLSLAAPVVLWGGLPFHQQAWSGFRHRTTTMDTLVSIGTLAAFGWSVYALFWGDAGMPGMRMDVELGLERQGGAGEIYLEVATGVTFFLLVGRYLEARARQKSGAALRALLELGAKDVSILRDGREVRLPVDQLQVDDRFVVRPGREGGDRRRGRGAAARPSTPSC